LQYGFGSTFFQKVVFLKGWMFWLNLFSKGCFPKGCFPKGCFPKGWFKKILLYIK